jgi:glycosyltransferase involved in cell wall biosynthesis
MKITQLNTHDLIGGAERASFKLCCGLRDAGMDVNLFVGRKISNEPWIYERSLRRGEGKLYWHMHYKWGYTEICFLSPFYDIFTHPAFFGRDIIHLHNLHGSYWNFLTLPFLARRSKIVITPHDEWPNTGDCAYTYSCLKWQTGCGRCPQVGGYALGFQDRTRFNKKLKDKVLGACRMTIVVESRWLANQISMTRWARGKEIRVIPNGIDVDLFKPIPKEEARDLLKVDKTKLWLLIFVPRVKDPRKGVEETLEAIAGLDPAKNLGVMLVGGDGNLDVHLPFETYHRAQISSDEELKLHYCAADLFILGTKSDNQPLSIIEAMCCGTPVISTRVGGVTEMIDVGSNGWLAPPSDVQAMKQVILEAIQDPCRLRQVGLDAAKEARNKYSLSRHVSAHIELYEALANKN